MVISVILRASKHKKNFVNNIKMTSLSLNEMKLITKSRGIKDYKNKSKDESKEILSKPESKINYLKLSIKEIREKFNDSKNRFLSQK